MKAALRVVTACVNVMLFLLSSSNAARLLALLTTLGAWWWLSDYYFAPWPWWMDGYAFILCSFLVLVALSAAVFWFGVRRPARRLAPSFDVFSGKASNTRLEISNWCQILRTIAGLRKGLWARYWTWYRLRLGETWPQTVAGWRQLAANRLVVPSFSVSAMAGSLLLACPLGFAAPGPPT